MSEQPSLDSILEASKRINNYANKTPVLTSQTFNLMTNKRLYFKCELFQKVGAFKFRGACNAVMKLSEEECKNGVVTHSSGNHAQALALAAKIRGIPSFIIMPQNAPAIKKKAVAGYGGNIIECVPTLKAREETAAQVIKTTGAKFIHPYDNDDIISGQGTMMIELYEQVISMSDRLDAVIAPVGGGGMLSGICIAAKALNPNIKIIAAEPKGADDCKRSFDSKKLIPMENPKTIADGLLTSLGAKTWPIIQQHVYKVITVSEEEIANAMMMVWERMKITIEPSSAVAVAVVLSKEFQEIPGINSVGIILSGGNVDLNKLPFKM